LRFNEEEEATIEEFAMRAIPSRLVLITAVAITLVPLSAEAAGFGFAGRGAGLSGRARGLVGPVPRPGLPGSLRVRGIDIPGFGAAPRQIGSARIGAGRAFGHGERDAGFHDRRGGWHPGRRFPGVLGYADFNGDFTAVAGHGPARAGTQPGIVIMPGIREASPGPSAVYVVNGTGAARPQANAGPGRGVFGPRIVTVEVPRG
jgi:hypothetical protein